MTSQQILSELKNLSTVERMLVAEEALHLVHTDLLTPTNSQTTKENKNNLALAAQALYADYSNDKELTSFTVLDSEDVRAEG